jgi:hypothetical protein
MTWTLPRPVLDQEPLVPNAEAPIHPPAVYHTKAASSALQLLPNQLGTLRTRVTTSTPTTSRTALKGRSHTSPFPESFVATVTNVRNRVCTIVGGEAIAVGALAAIIPDESVRHQYWIMSMWKSTSEASRKGSTYSHKAH